MIRVSDPLLTRLEAAVGEAEQKTGAELVVVIAPSTATFHDIPVLAGSAAAYVALLVALFSPVHFAEVWIAIELPALFLLVALFVARSPRLVARLLSSRRKKQTCAAAAAQAFAEEAVHATPDRVGVLVFVTLLEGRVHVIGDVGINAVVPPGVLNATRFGTGPDPHALTSEDALCAGIVALGEALAIELPRRAGTHDNTLANAPRVRRTA